MRRHRVSSCPDWGKTSGYRPRRPACSGRVVFVLAFVLAGIGASSAAAWFTHTGHVPDNAFTTGSCMVPRVKDVQRGTLSHTVNGSVAVAVTSVDTSRAFLLFTTSHGSSRPPESLLRGTLASSTSLQFTRDSNATTPAAIDVSWSLVEYECGVLVQRGQLTQSATTVSATLGTPVGDLSRAFVTFSKTADAGSNLWTADDSTTVELASTTRLDAVAYQVNGHILAWQVIEFTTAGAAAVQRGTTSLGSTQLSTTISLPTAVDLSTTFVLTSVAQGNGGNGSGSRFVTARLTGATSLVIERGSTNSESLHRIAWQVVDLRDGSAVTTGTESFAAGSGSATVAVGPVDLRRAAPLTTFDFGGGSSGGSSDQPQSGSTFFVGGASWRLDLLDESQLQLTRGSTSGASVVQWQVVEWGRALTSGDCAVPRVHDIQRGSTASTNTGTLSVPINHVDTTKAFLVFTASSGGDRPGNAAVRGELLAGEIRFHRSTDVAYTMTLNWTVVEYECGVRVQRGNTSMTATNTDITLPTAVTMENTFVMYSKTPHSSHSSWGADDGFSVDLLSSTTLRSSVSTLGSGHSLSWQVVEFLIPGAISVQRGKVAFTSSDLSATVTLPSAADPATSFVLTSVASSGSGADVGARQVVSQLSSSTSLLIERSIVGTTEPLEEISWQVVTLRDGSAVSSGSQSMAAGVAQATVTVPAVDLRRATPLATHQYGAGQNSGGSTMTGSDVPGEAGWRMELLDTTSLRLTRAVSSAAGVVRWQIVQWGQA